MNRAVKFILLMGLVSLFGDITYEGARSVTGPFLATFGVSAILVGFVSGFGEFAGYAVRLLSGYVADKTKRYWVMTFAGYALILSIPLLAIANCWEIAAILLILERIGKAIRSPARDAMLSFAAKEVGRGWGFGIHEAMDQIGAIIGPLFLFTIFFMHGSYKEGFILLTIPATLTLITLGVARMGYPAPHEFEISRSLERIESSKLWHYTFFVFASVMGFASFPIISYHLKVQSVISDTLIPILYATAMGVDAVTALAIGKSYDRIGFKSLLLIPLLIPFTLLSFSSSFVAVLVGIVIWGAVMGVQETVMRAAIADLTKLDRRSTAYGIFNTAYGISLFAGSIIIGLLYDLSLKYLSFFVITVETVALLILLLFLDRSKERK